jgi:DNA repair protein RadA/Sms
LTKEAGYDILKIMKKSVFVCNECGAQTPKWNGKCPECGAWNSFVETALPEKAKGGSVKKSTASAADTIKLSDVDMTSEIRYKTGLSELDRVLGGGLVKGSAVLLGGEPGIGKSTLLLQICEYLCAENDVLYISGEESLRQIKLRAERLGVKSDNLRLQSACDAEAIAATIEINRPDIVIIDSIQTMRIDGLTSGAGSITQVRECANLFLHTAKNLEIPFFIVGHVNKDGGIAGPKVMEHIVDTVLLFEGERHYSYRILRAVKNRFGSTNEIGVFDMTGEGLIAVDNPSAMLLDGRPRGISGCAVAAILEGSRPILAEVQALVNKTGTAYPVRVASGLPGQRVAVLLAVLEKRVGMFISKLDVFINVVGGLRPDEPALDLPVSLALYSAVFDKPVDAETAAFGEVGLGGELRSAGSAERRIKEAERLGCKRIIIPKSNVKNLNLSKFDIEICAVSNLRQAFEIIN